MLTRFRGLVAPPVQRRGVEPRAGFGSGVQARSQTTEQGRAVHGRGSCGRTAMPAVSASQDGEILAGAAIAARLRRMVPAAA